jgi:hypothetical protein
MQDGTYPSRSFATFGPLGYSRRLPYLNQKLSTTFYMLGHRADVKHYTSFYKFAMSCVFSKQSLFLILCRRQYRNIIGPPSPEVIAQFCRVPLISLSYTPKSTQLVYLCRFSVRFLQCIFNGTSWI